MHNEDYKKKNITDVHTFYAFYMLKKKSIALYHLYTQRFTLTTVI